MPQEPALRKQGDFQGSSSNFLPKIEPPQAAWGAYYDIVVDSSNGSIDDSGLFQLVNLRLRISQNLPQNIL
jgi:hypothetical protein